MNNTFTVPTKVYVTRQVVADNIEFISPDQTLNHLPCSGGDHDHKIGSKRPIAIVWAENSGWRLCYECSKHLIESNIPPIDYRQADSPHV